MSLCDELAPNFLCAEIDALEVDRRHLVKDGVVQLILPVRILRVDQKARNVDARIVDENVDVSELLLRRRDHCRNAVALCHIGDHVEHLALLFVKGRCLRVHIADDDIRALRQKLLGDRLADPRCAPGNNRRLPFKIQPTHSIFSFSLQLVLVQPCAGNPRDDNGKRACHEAGV